MPKVGMEPIRRQQLIEATLESVAELGLHATTINSISKRAGLSSGIISHYFGGKDGLLEATVRFLLNNLRTTLVSKTQNGCTPKERLMFIVEANFSVVQQSARSTKTWLSFWAQSMHAPRLGRLQRINAQRLYSNLLFSLNSLMSKSDAQKAAKLSAGMIDGLWLRAVLSQANETEFKEAEQLAKHYIENLISLSGD
ncbi:transcriptional regulator BetI [Alteromonas aestuariivivens]|uniref:HTH-type transcriptional regulator BetI n=1 Tax=Alteromonas aestuariivivens TaxID=1938339 RepID=A0A3D8MEU3_9ALTE|nr:transcriptional regulator BetI [Alteromonas aestuariivivens]RDV29136.1 transcriptional regulator BetI [Alteromonas aestuariivivens]